MSGEVLVERMCLCYKWLKNFLIVVDICDIWCLISSGFFVVGITLELANTDYILRRKRNETEETD